MVYIAALNFSRSLVQSLLLSLFFILIIIIIINVMIGNPPGICLDSKWILIGLGSVWIQVNLVVVVGIWWEFGRSPGQIWVGSH